MSRESKKKRKLLRGLRRVSTAAFAAADGMRQFTEGLRAARSSADRVLAFHRERLGAMREGVEP